MTTWYMSVSGHSVAGNWEMGMYTTSPILNTSGAFNTWTSALFSFFDFGVIHAFGYSTHMSTQSSTLQADMWEINEATDRKRKTASNAFVIAGADNTTIMPDQCAMMVLLHPAIRGGHRVGRMYLPPKTGAHLGAGVFTDHSRDETADFLSDMFGQMALNNLAPVLRNRQEHLSTPVTKFAVSNVVASLHSRGFDALPRYVQRDI
jgi:hypothetical protein